MRPWGYNRLWATRYCDYKPLSSTGACRQEPKEHSRETEPQNDSHIFYKDFDSFRAAVDRAIARDPYGTLFGRRLQSPPSSNNSSWTSFSWFTDSKEIKEDAGAQLAQPNVSANTKAPAEKPSAATSDRPVQQVVKESTVSHSEEEYDFDPITMRKVPRKKSSVNSGKVSLATEADKQTSQHKPEPEKNSTPPETPKSSPASKPKQPFLQSLFFQEHGIDIPVKTFKPHKVYGYGTPEKRASDTPAQKATMESRKDFDTSRKQHLRDLMSRVKGNNLDTTALFTEANPVPEPVPTAMENETPKAVPTTSKREFPKSVPITSEMTTSKPVPTISEVTTLKKPRESQEPDDTLPLFSGTAYEAKASKKANVKSSDWLAKEGFRQPVKEAKDSTSTPDSATTIPVKKLTPRLEPALDRVHSRRAQEPKDEVASLQTALDRHQSASKRDPPPLGRSTEIIATIPQKAVADKQSKRMKLEADFEARQKDAANEADFSPKTRKIETSTSKLTKTMNDVWEHIREHPDGIVAKTMRSMSNLNENYKKYIRPDAVKGLTDKLLFKDESLSKTPSIYKQNAKPRTVNFVAPSYDVLDAENAQKQRSADLQAAAEKTKKDAEAQKTKLSQLATEIQNVYESAYGTINASHRQPSPSTEQSSGLPAESAPSEADKMSEAHPLSTATVKPGVTTNPVTDEHINKFEPKFWDLLYHAKQVHAQQRDIRMQVEELQKIGAARSAEDIRNIEEAKQFHSRFHNVLQGTREVRRALHETKIALRAIESKRPTIAWTAGQMPGSDFGTKRIEINARIEKEDPDAIIEKTSESETKSQTPAKADEKEVPESVHTPTGSPTWNDEQVPSIEDLRKTKFDSPFLILAFDQSSQKVTYSPLNQPAMDMSRSSNIIHILGRLRHASDFLKHFQAMQSQGYSLYNGTDDMLIFQKEPKESAKPSTTPAAPVNNAPSVEKPTSIPVKEPNSKPVGLKAAEVLDELPTELDPPPGPAAPSAPMPRPFRGEPKVRRQEKVFSGTIRPSVAASAPKALEGKPVSFQPEAEASKPQTESLWWRFARAVRRTVLTITALGAGAYTIGFIADGVGAQQQKAIENGEAPGRKRIVATGTRPGIFSTESSR